MGKFLTYFSGFVVLVGLSIGINGYQNTLEFGLNQIKTTRFVVDGERLFLDGIINAKTYRQFVEIIEDNPQVQVVVQGEVLGSIDDDVNIKLGYELRRLGLDTHLSAISDVRSGGVDLFLAGVKRTIEDGAVLGVHSWTDNSVDGADLPGDHPEHALTRDYIAAMLGTDAFYWFTLLAAPSGGIYLMTPEDIENFGLLSGG